MRIIFPSFIFMSSSMEDLELTFDIKDDEDPGNVLTHITQADTDQSYSLSIRGWKLIVASQIDRSANEIREFVRASVGDRVQM